MNTVTTPSQAESITLYYREGSSDKVHQASIQPNGELFLVTFAYGRRGMTLQDYSLPRRSIGSSLLPRPLH